MIKRLAFVVVLGLTACASVDKTAITACSGYALALSTAADLKAAGKLLTSEILVVNQSIAVLDPVCTQDTLPTLDATTAASVETAAANLATVIKGK